MSLTNKINNLTTSSNNTTGASDTTLTNAVIRLINGYGDGNGGIIKEIIIPQQTLNTSIKTTNGYGNFFTNYVRYPVEGEQYLVTFDNVEYIAKAKNYSADNALCIGDINVIYASSDSRLIFPFVVVLTTSNSFFLSTRTNANHTIKVEKIELIEDLKLTEKNITSNGTYSATNDNADGYSSVTVNVSSSSIPTLQSKTVTPTESIQTITADSNYDGLSFVQVNAIGSSYIGSGITRRNSTDLTTSGTTVTVPAGYYGESATKSLAVQTYYTGNSDPSTSLGNDGDIYLKVVE